MSITKMSLVSVIGKMDYLDQVMMQLLQQKNFHPEEGSVLTSKSGSLFRLTGENPYAPMVSKALDVGTRSDYLSTPLPQQLKAIELEEQKLKQYLAEYRERQRQIGGFGGRTDTSFEEVLQNKLLKARFGRLPESGYSQLPHEEGYGKEKFFFCSFKQEGGYHWGAYFTAEEEAEETDRIFLGLGFERRCIPDQEIQEWLDDFASYLDSLKRQERELQESLTQRQNALKQLKHIEGLDTNFEDIFSSEFLKVRFGRLPAESLPKLAYYRDELFIFCSFQQDGQYHWGVYFTIEDYAPEIDDIFSSLYFERVRVPDDIHGTPAQARAELQRQIDLDTKELEEVRQKLQLLLEKERSPFQNIYARLRFLEETYALRQYVYVLNNEFHILGFIPQSEEENFVKVFSAFETVEVSIRPPDSDKRLVVPTKLKNNWFAKPFEQFVLMYGTPSYNDIDPTPIVAVTYTLLFGVMFGDLGQGFVIALLGFLMWKFKKMEFGRILSRIGVSSMIFGTAYGSVFGFEHLLDGFYQKLFGFEEKPIEVMAPDTTNIILGAAVGLGAVIIIFSILVNIVAGIRQKNWDRAVFSQNGVAGLLFYGYVLIGAVGMLLLNVNLFHPVLVILLIVLPLLVMFFKEPLGKLVEGIREKPEGGIGSFLIESFFELFEVVLSFITNTMSFLRVGGFVLSHAGMMAVVSSLAEMVGTGASPLVIVLGNLFVMAMEGLIVGIQALRLEFYEIFSRFYEGDGKPFLPVSAVPAEK